MKNQLILAALILLYSSVYSQNSKADKTFEEKGYAVYLQMKGMQNLEELDNKNLLKIAKSALKTGNHSLSEKVYKLLIEKDQSDVYHHLYYAQALQFNGKYLEARNHFKICDEGLSAKAKGKPYDLRAKRGWEVCNMMSELRSLGKVEIFNESEINSDKIDFSPSYYKDQLIFVSTRAKTDIKDRWLNDNYMDLYVCSVNDDHSLKDAALFADELKTDYHEGPLVFNKDFSKIYFTRNDFHKGKKGKSKDGTTCLNIYTADIEMGEWANEKEIDFNHSDFDHAHPALNKDEDILVFASNLKDSYGGMDLYASFKKGEGWSEPVNLGPGINTEGDELFPFIHEDGTLFFASNGQKTMGGLDIFMATQINFHPDSLWEFPFNIGAPINSSSDDFGLILNPQKKSGYFTSNRTGGKGADDIYRVEIKDGLDGVVPLPKLDIDVCVYDDDTRLRLSDATISLKRDTEFEEDTEFTRTNEFGHTLCKFRAGDAYFITVEKEGFFKMDDYFIMPKDLSGVEEYCIGLTRDHTIEIAEEVILEENSRKMYTTIDIPPVNYTYKRDEPLGPSHVIGKVLNKDYDRPLPNASVILLNRCTGEELVMEVDDNGDFGFPLECGCEYVVKSKKNKFFGDNQIISLIDEEDCNKGIELEMAMTPDFAPSGDPFYLENSRMDRKIKKGDVIELKSIYYDYDKWDIRADAAADLRDLVLIMKKYPSMEIELSSHTDIRGSDAYNNTLSTKRADSAKKYLVNKGIRASRIVAKGYGESKLKNPCKVCSESDHQQNRRTEVTITQLDKLE